MERPTDIRRVTEGGSWTRWTYKGQEASSIVKKEDYFNNMRHLLYEGDEVLIQIHNHTEKWFGHFVIHSVDQNTGKVEAILLFEKTMWEAKAAEA